MDDELNLVLLCLGSNEEDKERYIERADEYLRAHFASIRFTSPVYTESIGDSAPSIYLNQVAVFYSTRSAGEIRDILKDIERQMGREPKKNGHDRINAGHVRDNLALDRIPIDIDLIRWNDQILKPADWERDYVISGVRSLLSAGEDDEGGEQEAGGATCATVAARRD